MPRSYLITRHGRNQAVRIPRAFDAGRGRHHPQERIRKEGQRLIIELAPPKSLLVVLESRP